MNNTNSDLSDLKGKMGLWKKIRTINFSQFKKKLLYKIKIKIPFPITVRTKNLMIEFKLKDGNKLNGAKEIVNCPSCGKVVDDKYGICHMCGENVMQCIKCRYQSYEK